MKNQRLINKIENHINKIKNIENNFANSTHGKEVFEGRTIRGENCYSQDSCYWWDHLDNGHGKKKETSYLMQSNMFRKI